MPKWIFFDFDGTIANTKAIAYEVYLQMAKANNLDPLSKEEMAKMSELSIRRRLKVHNISVFRLPFLIKKSLPIFKEKIAEANPYQGMTQLLTELKQDGAKLAIISSNRKETIERFLSNHQINHFDFIIGKASLFGKARVIRSALKRMKISKHNALYVGDEQRDVIAAKKVPLAMIAVAWGYDHFNLLEESNPEYLIDDVRDLSKLLKRWIKS